MKQGIFVYIDLSGSSHLVGRLWMRQVRGRESATFEYTPSWLAHPDRFALEPLLSLDQGAHHTLPGHAVFGAIGDSTPDRWGRMLIQRAERNQARAEKRTLRTLTEEDYLLAVGDFMRQGALRFKLDQEAPFLASQEVHKIPPMVKLGALLNATMKIGTDEDQTSDLQFITSPRIFPWWRTSQSVSD